MELDNDDIVRILRDFYATVGGRSLLEHLVAKYNAAIPTTVIITDSVKEAYSHGLIGGKVQLVNELYQIAKGERHAT